MRPQGAAAWAGASTGGVTHAQQGVTVRVMQISAPSPALAFIQRNGFLTTGDHPAVQRMQPVGADTVELIVGDPWTQAGDAPEDKLEGDHVFADTAATVLEQAVDGVKLVVRTPDGYIGREGFFSGDEQYFANALPGLTSQAAEVGSDLDGDGVDEEYFLLPVATQADANRLDPLIKPQIGDYPTRFEVEG
ncbi:MAG: hypothetical protein JWM86_1212 [Thermoleophilia bacterium]|nr:hypothetical protein [Thermoleophilia bacterium]